jgi:hypothetical protein
MSSSVAASSSTSISTIGNGKSDGNNGQRAGFVDIKFGGLLDQLPISLMANICTSWLPLSWLWSYTRSHRNATHAVKYI